MLLSAQATPARALRTLPLRALVPARASRALLGTPRAAPAPAPAALLKRYKGGQACCYCDAHMNELPIPCGPWGPWYKAQQAAYSRMLALGFVLFIASGVAMVASGSFELNFSPPDRPSPPTRVAELCD